MANGLNRVTLVGNVGMDPELKYTQGGQAVLRIRMATNESWLDKGGTRQERTEWHTVIVWGKRAEGLNKVLNKGTTLWVEGRLQTRNWETPAGEKRYATEINASDLGLVGGKRNGGDTHEERAGHGSQSHGGQGFGYDAGTAAGAAGAAAGGTGTYDDDDDIPF